MNLLDKLLGKPRRDPTKMYVDRGMALTHRLVETLRLPGWYNGRPSYTPEENAAVTKSLNAFQATADDVMGGGAHFHPDVVGEIQRPLIANALEDLARAEWNASDKTPENWKDICSTYLKAWTCQLNPSAMSEVAELLAEVGYRSEAREAWDVVCLFQWYSHHYFAGAENAQAATRMIVERAERGMKELS